MASAPKRGIWDCSTMWCHTLPGLFGKARFRESKDLKHLARLAAFAARAAFKALSAARYAPSPSPGPSIIAAVRNPLGAVIITSSAASPGGWIFPFSSWIGARPRPPAWPGADLENRFVRVL